MSLGCHDYCLDSTLLLVLLDSGDILAACAQRQSVDKFVYSFFYSALNFMKTQLNHYVTSCF